MQINKKAGLYIHIPFCRSKCRYCDFYSLTSFSLKEEFLIALKREMELYKDDFILFDTLYIGGGTPSVLSLQEIGKIVEDAFRFFTFSPRPEITLEVNPMDIHVKTLKALKSLGINRLSLGIQSFNDEVLKFLGRRHLRKEAIDTIIWVKEAGFSNFGLDLIYGIPGQKLSSWEETLSVALSFHPPHLSCYTLSVEDNTPLGMSVKKGEIKMPKDEEIARLMNFTSRFLEGAGYLQYEVSNFCRHKRFRSRHNSKYWDYVPYLGLGPSAHSFDGRDRRWWNYPSLLRYLKDLQQNKLPVAGEERLQKEERLLERLFLGMRTKKGLPIRELKKFLAHRYEKAAQYLVTEGLAEVLEGHLKPTSQGLAFADGLALWLLNFAEFLPSPEHLTP